MTQKWLKSDWAWVVVGLLSLVWWRIAAGYDGHHLVLVVALSLASFAVGCLIGFLFTSYGEEAGTVGKVRDWLVGGLTGITVVKAGAIRDLLVAFAADGGPNGYAIVVAFATTYSVLGFFFMFFQQELIFNVLLAASRAERGRIEGTREAGLLVQRFLTNLPVSILSGIEDVDEIDLDKEESAKLYKLLDSDDTNRFLEEADKAVKAGNADWDIVNRAANLHYYRTYFEKDDSKKLENAKTAACWIDRALVMNPTHVDMTVKRAAIAGVMKKTEETIAILEKLNRRPEAPLYVKEWLGFYLLDFPDRLDESIQYSELYHSILPEESDSLFNIAAAYGRKYSRDVESPNRQPSPKDRELALSYLRRGLNRQPGYATTVREKMTGPDGSFRSLKDDSEFCSMLAVFTPQVENRAPAERATGA